MVFPCGHLVEGMEERGVKGSCCVPEPCFSAEMWLAVQLPVFLICLWLLSALCLAPSIFFMWAGGAIYSSLPNPDIIVCGNRRRDCQVYD